MADKKRTIYVSIPMVREAMQSKERTEALAFAMFIKMVHVNSILKGSIRSQKSTLHIGQNVLERAKTNAIKFGYITKDEHGNYTALPIRGEKRCFRYRLDFDLTEKRIVVRAGKKVRALGSGVRLADVVFLLKRIMLTNRVRQQNKYTELVHQVKCGNKCSRKKARRRLHSLWRRICRQEHTPYNNLSIKKMAYLFSSSKYSAINVLTSLIEDKSLERKVCVVPLKRAQALKKKRGELNIYFRSRCAAHYAEANMNRKQAGQGGYIYQHKGQVFLRMANIYFDRTNLITKRGGFANVPEK